MYFGEEKIVKNEIKKYVYVCPFFLHPFTAFTQAETELRRLYETVMRMLFNILLGKGFSPLKIKTLGGMESK